MQAIYMALHLCHPHIPHPYHLPYPSHIMHPLPYPIPSRHNPLHALPSVPSHSRLCADHAHSGVQQWHGIGYSDKRERSKICRVGQVIR